MNFLKEFFKELDDPVPLPRWLEWGRIPIAQAFILSLMFHFIFIIGWECAFQIGMVPTRPGSVLREMFTPEETLSDQSEWTQEQEVPLMFIEVDPIEEIDPPANAKYYSDKSTLAGNPDPVVISQENPQIEGEEQEMMRTLEKLHEEPQEMIPVQEIKGETIEQEDVPNQNDKPLFAAKPADLGVGKDENTPRPRTLNEARRKINLIGTPTKQKGGVKRHSLEVQLDVKGTPFGNYDAAFIAAVQKRWDALIEQSGMVTASGKVVIVFKLHYDGRITDIQEIYSSVSSLQALLCQRAILDPSPYSPWPSELRQAVQGNVRDVKFTFYYR